jgi:hypothetical protein
MHEDATRSARVSGRYKFGAGYRDEHANFILALLRKLNGLIKPAASHAFYSGSTGDGAPALRTQENFNLTSANMYTQYSAFDGLISALLGNESLAVFALQGDNMKLVAQVLYHVTHYELHDLYHLPCS